MKFLALPRFQIFLHLRVWLISNSLLQYEKKKYPQGEAIMQFFLIRCRLLMFFLFVVLNTIIAKSVVPFESMLMYFEEIQPKAVESWYFLLTLQSSL